MAPDIPERWLNYKPVGKQIEGTRFIAFKVPLRECINEGVKEELRLDDNILLKTVPNLGMIIDLTNTNRYYDPNCFEKRGLEYCKLMIPGHFTPPPSLLRQFKNLVITFLNNNSDNGKLIGVHCTHGVNRTGYLICSYMISELAMKPEEAIYKFELARGHKIERTNYLKALNEFNETHRQEPISWRAPPEPISWRAPPEPVLTPSPQVFDRRSRFERFEHKEHFTSAAIAEASRTKQQQLNNSFPRERNTSTNYSSRYVNTSSGIPGDSNYPYHNNHNSNAMILSNTNFDAHAPNNRRDDDGFHRRQYPAPKDIRYDDQHRPDRYRSRSNHRV